MGLAVLIQFLGNALGPYSISHLRHGTGTGVPGAQQLIGSETHHRQDQHHDDDIHNIEFTLCFLFHSSSITGKCPVFLLLWTMFGKYCILFFQNPQDHFLK